MAKNATKVKCLVTGTLSVASEVAERLRIHHTRNANYKRDGRMKISAEDHWHSRRERQSPRYRPQSLQRPSTRWTTCSKSSFQKMVQSTRGGSRTGRPKPGSCCDTGRAACGRTWDWEFPLLPPSNSCLFSRMKYLLNDCHIQKQLELYERWRKSAAAEEQYLTQMFRAFLVPPIWDTVSVLKRFEANAYGQDRCVSSVWKYKQGRYTRIAFELHRRDSLLQYSQRWTAYATSNNSVWRHVTSAYYCHMLSIPRLRDYPVPGGRRDSWLSH
jgi:hypothetical protein